jgi:hypothetical protein
VKAKMIERKTNIKICKKTSFGKNKEKSDEINAAKENRTNRKNGVKTSIINIITATIIQKSDGDITPPYLSFLKYSAV